mmetsp:Transcript_38889/g.82772  ORF Transcript_38889/g.82772 Transcript_38889/m.82772 type:complete len:208 (-) Transcript_38889:213-836(-)
MSIKALGQDHGPLHKIIHKSALGIDPNIWPRLPTRTAQVDEVPSDQAVQLGGHKPSPFELDVAVGSVSIRKKYGTISRSSPTSVMFAIMSGGLLRTGFKPASWHLSSWISTVSSSPNSMITGPPSRRTLRKSSSSARKATTCASASRKERRSCVSPGAAAISFFKRFTVTAARSRDSRLPVAKSNLVKRGTLSIRNITTSSTEPWSN